MLPSGLIFDMPEPRFDPAHTYAWALDAGEAAVPQVIVSTSLDQAASSALQPRELRLWAGAPKATTSELLNVCRAVLSPTEVARADQFRSEADARAFLAAHAALRLILAGALGCRASDLRFGVGTNGKPALAGIVGRTATPALQFNLSHTRTRALVGLSEIPVGVDVQPVEDIPDMMDTARVAFAPETVAVLRAAQGEERVRLFYRFWALGEAFIKATGLGISQGLDSFTFSAEGAPALLRVTPGWGPASRWRFGLPGE